MPLNWIKWTDRVVFAIGYIYFFLFLIFPTDFSDRRLTEDPMVPTGFAVVLGGVWLGYMLQGSFRRRITELFDSGAILMPPDGQVRFWRGFDWLVRWASPAFAVILYLGCGFLLCFAPQPDPICRGGKD